MLILNQLVPIGVFSSTPALNREIIIAGIISQQGNDDDNNAISMTSLHLSKFNIFQAKTNAGIMAIKMPLLFMLSMMTHMTIVLTMMMIMMMKI